MEVNVRADVRANAPGLLLSTGSTLSPCPRNVFTVSRVDDNDGFDQNTFVHYGQVIRLGTGTSIRDRPYYLWASPSDSDARSSSSDPQVCVYPRAAAGTYWKILKAASKSQHALASSGKQVHSNEKPQAVRVKLGDVIRLESVLAGCELQSDGTVVMTSYGNEWRIFGATGSSTSSASKGSDVVFSPAFGPSNEWSFVDSRWTDRVIKDARQKVMQVPARTPGLDKGLDPGLILSDPLYSAEAQLKRLDAQGVGKGRYAVLERIYPVLRGSGMHVIRRLRRMCQSSDDKGQGELPMASFQGFLSYVGIRLGREEVSQLLELFPAKDPGSNAIDYHRFFALMGEKIPKIRMDTIEDAYKKLKAYSGGDFAEVIHLQRRWNPACFPEVQRGLMTESEALEEFLRQWDITSSDGLVSFNDFLSYYLDVSLAVKDDALFIELVRSAWNL